MKRFTCKLIVIFLLVAGFWYVASHIIIEKPEPMKIQFSVNGEWKDAEIVESFEGERSKNDRI